MKDYTEEQIMKILGIGLFDNDDMTNEEFDALTLNRFNIRNYKKTDYQFKNYYVFTIPSAESNTGYEGMCIKKEHAETIKNNLEKWKNGKK